MVTYLTLQERPREFLAATSLTVAEFDALLPAFAAAYAQLYPPTRTATGQVRQRAPGAGVKPTLAGMAAKLLFILIYHKTNPLQTMHGLQFGLGQPQTNYWIHRLLPVLQMALQTQGQTPERAGTPLAGSPHLAGTTPQLVIDGTERRRPRPKDPSAQTAHYSGKKKAHTDKNILLVAAYTRQVVYLGATVPGTRHDKKAADDAAIHYPAQTVLDKDTGFQGYEPAGVWTRQPTKKPRGRELSAAEKLRNGWLASGRVVVEHVIAGIKRCRIVKEVLRLTTVGISDQVMEIACGLHNLRQAARHPEPKSVLHQLLLAA